MMRKLVWFTVGTVVACLVGVYWLSGVWLPILAAICFVVAAALFLLKNKVFRIAAVALIGCTAGLLWFWGYDALYLNGAREYDCQVVETKVEVIDYSYETEYGYGTDGKIRLGNKTYRIRFYSHGESYAPGDVVEGKFALRFTASGGEKSPTHHQGKSIFLLGNCNESLALEKAEKIPLRYCIAQFRKNIQNTLDAAFPEDTVGFARALLLGDSSKLTERENNDFSTSGISHIIAVSGMHVSIMCALLYTFFDERKVTTAFIGIPLLIAFAALAGFTPSVMRAVVMQILMILALLLEKEYDPPTALAFSVLTMLAVNPLVITSVSLQLSAGCMIGIMLFSSRIHRYILKNTPLGPAKGKSRKARFIRWLVGSISITISATIVTTPLCAYYFGMVSLVGIVTNLVTLWVVSFIFYGIMVAGVASAIWLPLGQIIAWVIAWPIRYVQLAAKWLSQIPFAAVYTDDLYVVAWLIVAYVLFAVLMFSKKKRPFVFLGCVLGCLAVCLGLSALERSNSKYSVTVLDVGQGQSVLLQSGDATYLVDCGGDSGGIVADTVRQALLADGIRKIDGLILTHYDADHANGVLPLLEAVQVDRLYLPDIDADTDMKERIISQHSDKITMVSDDMVLDIPDGKLHIFSAVQTANENDNSLCILFQSGNCDILITGDRAFSGEKALIEKAELPQIEILVVGHHGSDSSTSLELLDAIQPADAVISVGKDNSFGHPTKETLLRLWMYECRVWRTDINGTIRFRG